MSTITREFTKEQLIEWAKGREDNAALYPQFTVKDLALVEIALASLEAKPIGAFHIADQQVGGTTDYIKDGEWPIDDGVIEVYAAPPAPVSVPDYPETLPCPVMLDPGLRFGKGVPTKTMLGALQRRAEYYADLEAMTPEQRAEHDAGMKELAAMLQGADGNSPVIPDGWIPVGDRMPQTGETVALIGPDVAEPVTGYLTDYGEFVWALEKHSHSILVSHWMPFPAVTRQEGK